MKADLQKLQVALLAFKSDEKNSSIISDNYFARRTKEKLVVPVVLSNDFDPIISLKQLDQSKPLFDPACAIAIIIGEGCILDSAPSYIKHCELILFIDKDPVVLAHNKFLITTLLEAKNINDFIDRYSDTSKNPVLKIVPEFTTGFTVNPLTYERQIESVHTKKMLIDIMLKQRPALDFLGKYACFSSEERFIECQTAIKQLSFAYLELDFACLSNATKLQSLIEEHHTHIAVLQVTNLYEYAGEFALNQIFQKRKPWKATSELPTVLEIFCPSDTVYVLYSCMDPQRKYMNIACRFATNITEYLADNTANATRLNQDCVVAWDKQQVFYGPSSKDVVLHFQMLVEKYKNNPKKQTEVSRDLEKAQDHLVSDTRLFKY